MKKNMKKHAKTLRKLDDCPTSIIINYFWFDDYVWMFGIIITKKTMPPGTKKLEPCVFLFFSIPRASAKGIPIRRKHKREGNDTTR